MATQLPANDSNFFNTDNVLIDTNIWLAIDGPESYAKSNKYDETYYKLLESNAHLYVNFSIISEFVNRFIRISYASYLKQLGYNSKEFTYKTHYRSSEDFKEHYSICLRTVQEDILNKATLIGTSKQSGYLALQDSEIYANSLDFNDLLIIHDCLEQNFKILTADSDYLKYTNGNLKVIH